jgi:hypothetical protein
MFDPGAARRLTSSAPANVAPLEMPQKMPSFRASSRVSRSDSAPFTPMISSTRLPSSTSLASLGMKSGDQPCIRCGRNDV